MKTYHCTNKNYESFDLAYTTSQLGIHVGNFAQAKNIADSHLSNGDTETYILTIEYNFKNTLRMPDCGSWQGGFAVNAFKEATGLDIYISAGDSEIRRILLDAGYDSIIYENDFEGQGNSYISLNPNEQLKIVDKITINEDNINSPFLFLKEKINSKNAKKEITKEYFPHLFNKLNNQKTLSELYENFYHVTTLDSAKNILLNGFNTEEYGKIHGSMNIKPPVKTTYFSKHPSSNNLNSALFENDLKLAIIEVNTSGFNEDFIYPDDAFWCAFSNEQFLEDPQEVAEFFDIPIDEASILLNLMENCTNEELVDVTKQLWKLYLIKEGEISTSQNINKDSISTIYSYDRRDIIYSKEHNLNYISNNKETKIRFSP